MNWKTSLTLALGIAAGVVLTIIAVYCWVAYAMWDALN